jgi:hypothetical protein
MNRQQLVVDRIRILTRGVIIFGLMVCVVGVVATYLASDNLLPLAIAMCALGLWVVAMGLWTRRRMLNKVTEVWRNRTPPSDYS